MNHETLPRFGRLAWWWPGSPTSRTRPGKESNDIARQTISATMSAVEIVAGILLTRRRAFDRREGLAVACGRRIRSPNRACMSMTSTDSGHRTLELDGFEILVGRSARDNDRLSLRTARPRDLWLHAHGFAGSHVVVRHPEGTGDVPRHVIERAAELAAWHSKARGARGKVSVHLCRAADVSKPRGAPPGQVRIRRHETVKVYPKE